MRELAHELVSEYVCVTGYGNGGMGTARGVAGGGVIRRGMGYPGGQYGDGLRTCKGRAAAWHICLGFNRLRVTMAEAVDSGWEDGVEVRSMMAWAVGVDGGGGVAVIWMAEETSAVHWTICALALRVGLRCIPK
jgi:hypothetical protein